MTIHRIGRYAHVTGKVAKANSLVTRDSKTPGERAAFKSLVQQANVGSSVAIGEALTEGKPAIASLRDRASEVRDVNVRFIRVVVPAWLLYS